MEGRSGAQLSNAKFEPKPCFKLLNNCFANKNGLCMILTDTWFPNGKSCPFYATQDEVDAKRWAARKRLIEIDKLELELKYMDGGE